MHLKTLFRNRTIVWYLVLFLLVRFSMNVTGTTYAIFLAHKGFNPLQINLVNLTFYLVMLVFEVPTGALADIWGRKNCFVSACILMGIGLFGYAQAQSFLGCATAEGVLALGATLYSGAFSAWLCDTLKAQGQMDLIKPTFSLGSILGNGTGILAGLVGGYTASFNLAFPFYAGALAAIPAVILSLVFMKETKYRQRKLSRVWPMLCIGVRYVATHPTIRFLFLMGLLQSLATQTANMQWQPTFEKLVGGPQGLGWLMTAMFLAMMAGSYVALHHKSRHPMQLLVICQVGIGVGIILTPLTHSLTLMLLAFLGHEVFRGIVDPVKQAYLNHEIRSSRRRATVLSCDALGRDLGGVIGLPLWGLVTVHSSMSVAWVAAGLFLVFAILGLRAILAIRGST